MKKCSCTICSFENPHPCATAIVIQNGKLLLLKRNEEPFKGWFNLPGGYIQKNETPEQAIKREVKEELGLECDATFIDVFTGKASYNEFEYPVLDFAYLVELRGKNIKLDGESSKKIWAPISSIKDIAFITNQKMVKYVQKNLNFDILAIKKLIQQLDPRATFDEQVLYKAALDGHVSTIEKGGKLVGMGWIFIRQTALRKQAVVEDMIVDEKYRGMGYGEKILRDLLKWAKAQGVETIELTTNPRRIAANSLYKKVGFKFHETNHYLLAIKK